MLTAVRQGAHIHVESRDTYTVFASRIDPAAARILALRLLNLAEQIDGAHSTGHQCHATAPPLPTIRDPHDARD